MEELLRVSDLKVRFFLRRGELKAVDGVNINVHRNESVGLVGESGCGKSVTAFSIMGLIPHPGKVVGGQIFFEGDDLLKKNEREMNRIRGKKITMVFQDPLTSLNPVIRIGKQIAEAIERHMKLNKSTAWNRAIKMMELVGIPDAEERAREYPFQLSGGMRQRVMIGTAISTNPLLLIADEPTTNLDVTVQAQIVDLIDKLKKETGTSLLLITHNLGLITWLTERIYVMYGGKIVESGTNDEILNSPLHPYTQLLLRAIPRMDQEKNRLMTIKGSVPSLIDVPSGCSFHPRCPHAQKNCKGQLPQPVEVSSGHVVSCLMFSK
jgi:oligopeptide/dipeptide ABC transporter ATP-binding protein